MDYQIIPIDSQTWRIEDQGVRFFLLTGTERALLIDSGMNVHNAKEIAESLTSLPVELVNTHTDIDHIGSNEEFDAVYMNPAECYNFKAELKATKRVKPLWDGDMLDLGDRPITVITIPGHTPGSIALLDTQRRVLYSGDSIQEGQIFLFGSRRNLVAYYYSLLKMRRYEGQFDTIYPSHSTFPAAPRVIEQLIEGMERFMQGGIVPTEGEFHGTPFAIYDVGAARFLCDPGIQL